MGGGYELYFLIIAGEGGYPDDPYAALDTITELLHIPVREYQTVRTFSNISDLLYHPLLMESSGSRKKARNPQEEDAVIRAAKQYIAGHIGDDLTRDDVADAVFLDSAYFSRYFKKKTGQSFFDYLTSVRIQKATELLGTRMLIKDIYEKVGYHDRKYFTNIFRQHTGYTPSEYRKKVLNMMNPAEE